MYDGCKRQTADHSVDPGDYKYYIVVHEHCSDVVTLSDLDNDPDTVTFEVKKFSTFVLAVANIIP